MAVPSIPPRPSRSQNMSASANTIDVPQVPARPRRSIERSVSPNRDTFARSPLNNPAYLYKVPSSDRSSGLAHEVPIRPPSVTLPSVGQEGSEYDHATPQPDENSNPLHSTASNVAHDLPLHAPKASLPVSSAKQRIAAVTRTDSSQAAALGIGKAHSNASETELGHTLTRSSSRQSTGAGRSRPPSLYKQDTNEEDEERGIPHIGLHVPMYPNAGDVQAPTPSPGMPPPSTGVGFFNNVGGSSTPRNHSRTKSGREVFHGPPGSYGLHGHGVNKTDPFEKAWYDKHPEALAREAKGEYGPAISDDRREWALSSEELNKLVHTKSQTGMGKCFPYCKSRIELMQSAGASPNVIGTPGEDVGYLASEEYAQRLSSRPPSTKPRRPSSQTFAESPLRKTSFPAHEAEAAARSAGKPQGDNAFESEAEDDTIHVDVARSPRRFADNKPALDLGATGGNTSERGGYYVETGEGVPILASDESAFRPDAKYLQPAIEPEFERRDSSYLDLGESLSRPHSRSNSVNAGRHQQSGYEQLRSENIGTPLETVRDYEPLFDDEDEPRSGSAPAAIGSPEKFKNKRPDLARHHFPSQDVWEDAPDSLNYVTTVETPQPEDDSHPAAEHEPSGVYEPPEAEEARKRVTGADQENYIPQTTKDLAKNKYKPEVLGDVPTRPGYLKQRFPSQDVWEDTPSSSMYTTEVDPDNESIISPVEQKQPDIPTRPVRKSQPEAASGGEARQVPIVPGRPKPHVPARPSKLRGSDASEEAPLAKSLSKDSADSAEGAPQVKSKPAVPARPGGSKIAALQAGFMSDLNKKLGLGPQAPKKEEPEPEAAEEKAPLEDARKGRARGPQRRRPGAAAGDAGSSSASSRTPIFKFTITRPQTIWEVDEGVLSVPVAAPTPATAKAISEAAEKQTPAEIQFEPVEVTEESADLEKTGTKESIESVGVDSSVQTGQTEIETVKDASTGESSKATAYLDGSAKGEGTVVVGEDGKEITS